ncbi:MAG TPA: hypothetical protein VFT22_31350 [Kofleriaceae bacterium]|nr:hypothetical protein [Kofleriaceae bacterium]
MTVRAARPVQRAQAARARGSAPDATVEPELGPPPEAVFDRVTGPYGRRAAAAMPGPCAHDEDA